MHGSPGLVGNKYVLIEVGHHHALGCLRHERGQKAQPLLNLLSLGDVLKSYHRSHNAIALNDGRSAILDGKRGPVFSAGFLVVLPVHDAFPHGHANGTLFLRAEHFPGMGAAQN